MSFCFGIHPHAGLRDRDAGPAFSREHGHLGTMGEQCCALNGLPRFINKNEQINKYINLKAAKAIPIYKKADAAVFSNYRPVTLLPCFSKILERLFFFVFNRCVDYINTHEILNDKQFGFRQKYSTYNAIAQMVDKINTAVEKNESTVGIFLDLPIAFNTSSQIRTLRISSYSA